MIRPAKINQGDTIAVVAPAGPIERRDEFLMGVAALERLGFRVRFNGIIFHSTGYLAGSDEDRANDLIRTFEDTDVRAIVSLRGGYGCARLIPLIDERRVRAHPKIFMGFSDLTTLHLFFRRRFGWVTFHGPMATSPALRDMTPEQETHLFRLWTDPAYRPSLTFPEMQAWTSGRAEGELVGGCLSLVVASLGTPYEPATDGKILFLEDLGEPPYRVDRMITQLRLAGKLDHLAGILLGSFKDCDPGTSGVSVEDTLKDLLAGRGIPVLSNFPAGHGADNWVLPLGAHIRLDAGAQKVDFLEPAIQAD